MATDRFHHGNTVLHFDRTGNGPALLLFHGFGQSHASWKPLTDALAPAHTVYSFDLYFHGHSTWSDDERPLEKGEWAAIISAFLRQQQIDTFYVGGFSLGGKFALCTVEAFPQRTIGVLLLAPDGVKTSFWYSLATYPLLLRRLFKSMIVHHQRFLALTRWLYRLRLADKGLLRFAEVQMSTEEKRRQVYYAWVVFRHLRPDLKTIAAQLNAHDVPVTLLVGRYDKVIRPENMQRLVGHIGRCRFAVLETGHNGLIAMSAGYVAANGLV